MWATVFVSVVAANLAPPVLLANRRRRPSRKAHQTDPAPRRLRNTDRARFTSPRWALGCVHAQYASCLGPVLVVCGSAVRPSCEP